MFSLQKVFSLIFLSLFLFSFASAIDTNFVDLAITNVTVDGNLYGENITFTVDYNNLGNMDYNESDVNFEYDINGLIYYASNSYTWDANLLGLLDINICVNYPGDTNLDNDCNAFDLNVYSVDLNAVSLTSTDTAVYGEDYNLEFSYNNLGDYYEFDYNIEFYFDSSLADIIELSDVNSDLTNHTYTFNDWNLVDDLEDINAYACLVYSNDVDEANNCMQFDFNALHYDLNAVSLSLSDSSVDEGESLTATLTYKNSGDLNATSGYTVVFYYNSTQVCTTSNTITTDLLVGNETTKTCTFTAPNVSSNTTYTIKGVVNYTNDYVSNNEATANLSVANVTSTSTGGSDSDDDEDDDLEIDLEALSLVYPSESEVDKEVTFTFKYKNIGDDDLTASYSVKVEISHKGDLIKKCSKTITTDLDSDESTSYICDWTPDEIGYYSLYAEVTYSSDDDEDNDYIDNKVIRIIDKKAVITTKTISDNTENVLFSDLNDSFENLDLLALDYNNYLFSDVEVVRDFNVVLNDDNTYTTHVKLILTTDSNSVLENYFYYEYLPDENKFLEFELDLNGNATLEYDLNYDVSEDKQAEYYGALFSKDLVNEPKPIYNSDKGSVLYYIAMVVLGLIIIALIVWLILKIINSRKNQFNPYKKHKKVVKVEEKHSWAGWNIDPLPNQKYKGGKFKHKEPKKDVSFKGWK